MLNSVIKNRLKSYTVSMLSGEGYVNGEWSPTYEDQSKELYIVPIGTRDLAVESHGTYTRQDIKLYEIGTPTIPVKSKVRYKNKDYEIKEVVDRNDDGGFSYYLAKKDEQ